MREYAETSAKSHERPHHQERVLKFREVFSFEEEEDTLPMNEGIWSMIMNDVTSLVRFFDRVKSARVAFPLAGLHSLIEMCTPKEEKTKQQQQICEATLYGNMQKQSWSKNHFQKCSVQTPNVLQQETEHGRQPSLIASQHAVADSNREQFVFGSGRADASNLLCTCCIAWLIGTSIWS